MDKRVLLLKKLILSEIQSPPTIEKLSAQINVSPSRLRQIFKTETGMSFGEYVRHLQMEHACKLLKTTFIRVKEVSMASGFYDQSYFDRIFKGKYGISPKEYRNKNHKDLKKLNGKL